MNTIISADLVIIGGFLGAGKTTLVNQLLTTMHDRRVAVLVNDFGSINIDERLILQKTDRIVSLSNGCICCEIGSNVYQTLFDMLQVQDPPDLIIVEASGVADPGKLAVIGRVGKFFKLRSIVTVVDAANVRARHQERYIKDTIERQIYSADLLIVNKSDLVSEQELQSLNKWLNGIAPHALQIHTTNGVIPPEVVLGGQIDSQDSGRTVTKYSSWQKPLADTHTDRFESWTFTTDRPLHLSKVCEVFDELPTSMLRAKGILWLAEHGEVKTVFQFVEGKYRMEQVEHWGNAPKKTEIVFITSTKNPDITRYNERLLEAISKND